MRTLAESFAGSVQPTPWETPDVQLAKKAHSNGPAASPGYGGRPNKHAPKSCHCCHREEFKFLLWKDADVYGKGPQQARVAPARCNSWRHPGPCAERAAARDFRRVVDAFEAVDVRDLVFLVLTVPRAEHGGFSTRNDAFRGLCAAWKRLKGRLEYHLRRQGLDPIGSRYVMVVEQHHNGWPHANVVLCSRDLADAVRRRQMRRLKAGKTQRQSELVGGETSIDWGQRAIDLLDHVVASGFGRVSTAAVPRPKVSNVVEALAGYLTKLGAQDGHEFDFWGDLKSISSEATKMLQVPTRAPQNFRRFRSGRGFVKPISRWASEWRAVMVSVDGHVVSGATRDVAIDVAAGVIYPAHDFRTPASPEGP